MNSDGRVVTTPTFDETETTKVRFVRFHFARSAGRSLSHVLHFVPFTLHVPQGRVLCDSNAVLQVLVLVNTSVTGYIIHRPIEHWNIRYFTYSLTAIKWLTYLGYLFFTVLSNLFTSVVIELLIAQILVFSGSFGLCVDIRRLEL